MLKRLIAAIAALTVLASVQSGTAQAETISVHGSTTVSSTLLTPNKAKIEKKSGQRLNIVANGSGSGVKDLLSGKAQVAMISAPLDAVVAKLNQKDPGSVDGSVLVPHLVGGTTIAFVVHPSNPVKSLTMKQVTDILTGRIKNWKEVGGKNAPITVMAENKGGGARSLVEKKLLYGGDLVATVKETGGGAATVTKGVAANPNGFGVSMDAALDKTVAQVTTDKTIRQPLILVTIGDPDANVMSFINAARSTGFF